MEYARSERKTEFGFGGAKEYSMRNGMEVRTHRIYIK